MSLGFGTRFTVDGGGGRNKSSGADMPAWLHVPEIAVTAAFTFPSYEPLICEKSIFSDDSVSVAEAAGIPLAPWSRLSSVAVKPPLGSGVNTHLRPFAG
jgi:hypothetical protein